MDREILFRAKRIDKGEWVNGYITRIKHSDDKGKVETYYFNALDELGWVAECAVYAETVCQYTGLTDKNGRKIFEGDIVKIHYEYLEDSICKVIFNQGMFIGELVNGCEESIQRSKEDMEVIGNIFDNPELLGTGSASGQQGNHYQNHTRRNHSNGNY